MCVYMCVHNVPVFVVPVHSLFRSRAQANVRSIEFNRIKATEHTEQALNSRAIELNCSTMFGKNKNYINKSAKLFGNFAALKYKWNRCGIKV